MLTLRFSGTIVFMNDYYQTLPTASEGFYKEKGSKFLAFAYPVVSEESVKAQLDELKKLHYNARHHCYAFILKPTEGQEETYRASDAGEPPHSAGDPILGQIRSRQLHDVLVVVVRYFGGTKLGVSGLIHAYKTAAEDSLANNTIIKKYIEQSFTLEFDYTATSGVMQIIDQYQVTILDQVFVENCQYQLSVRISQYDAVVKLFTELAQVSVKL